MTVPNADHTADTSGLHCPLPLLHCKASLRNMRYGETLHLITSDHGSVDEIDRYLTRYGHELLECEQREGRYHFRLRKRGNDGMPRGHHTARSAAGADVFAPFGACPV